jgi:hypothetical protein
VFRDQNSLENAGLVHNKGTLRFVQVTATVGVLKCRRLRWAVHAARIAYKTREKILLKTFYLQDLE